MDSSDKLKEILAQSENVIFFGGAGMSTESGIPDFRSAGGIYNEKLNQEFKPEEMASHSFLMAHPEEFIKFYRDRRIFPDAKPNAGHMALVELERRGLLKAVITQNIDGLHQMAGSQNVYELHGSIHRWYCLTCQAPHTLEYIMANGPVPRCQKCGGYLRPDVVLYEEGLDMDIVDKAVQAIRAADTLIIGGTSLVVYPAAGLIDYFHGKNLVLINKSETKADSRANLAIHEPIGEVLSAAVIKLFD